MINKAEKTNDIETKPIIHIQQAVASKYLLF